MSASYPAISILLPVYNDARYVARAVTSIQRQTFDDWELLLLNDGSTDSSPALIDSLALTDPRIKPVHLPHRGIAGSLNAGIQRAKGRYVARMDADDISHALRLALQKDYLDERPDVCAVGCKIRIFPRTNASMGMLAYEAWLNSVITPEEIGREIFVESPLVHPSVMVRKEILESVNGYRHDGPEDYDLWLRLHGKGFRFAKVPRVLFWWMDRPDRATRLSPDYSREAFRRCKSRHLANFLGEKRPVLLAGNREAKHLAADLEREGLRVMGYVDVNPKRIGTVWNGKPVVGYEDLPGQYSGCVFLAAVGSRGVRDVIRNQLQSLGYREPHEFLCVA
jgi:glycosyltransferase involved in cell wall biosynthesis